MTHVNGPSCDACIEKLRQAHIDLVNWWTWLKTWNYEAHISCSFRDEADQDKAVMEGKSRAPWPHSLHNHTLDGRPYSGALDLFELLDNGEASWTVRFFEFIYKESLANGFNFVWGGNFKSFPDYSHFELPPGSFIIH